MDLIFEELNTNHDRAAVEADRPKQIVGYYRFLGRKVGEELLMNAYFRALDASKTIGIYAIVVDAKDDKAKAFCKHYDFMELADNAMALLIQLETVRDSIS